MVILSPVYKLALSYLRRSLFDWRLNASNFYRSASFDMLVALVAEWSSSTCRSDLARIVRDIRSLGIDSDECDLYGFCTRFLREAKQFINDNPPVRSGQKYVCRADSVPAYVTTVADGVAHLTYGDTGEKGVFPLADFHEFFVLVDV